MIYYSHVNEDNLAERNSMSGSQYDSLYVIAGSGERVIALLDHPGLESVHLIDNNREALYLCELKLAALENLSVDDYLGFVGFFATSGTRWDSFKGLKHKLSDGCGSYWEGRRSMIEQGICNCGHFEQFLKRANPILRRFLWKAFFQCLDQKKSSWMQFPYFKWRLVKTLFSYRLTYQLFGMRDPAFISKDALLEAIPAALQKSMDEDRTNESCLFHLVFKGHLRDMPAKNLPPSFQRAVLTRVKESLQLGKLKMHYHCDDLLDTLKELKFESKESRFFSVSDIMSFADMSYLNAVILRISKIQNGSNTLVFRSFVRHRLKAIDLLTLRDLFGKVTDLSRTDRTHFYQTIQIDLK